MAVVFIFILGWVSYDISQRTTSPGSKGQLMERIKKRYDEPLKNPGADTVALDSTAVGPAEINTKMEFF